MTMTAAIPHPILNLADVEHTVKAINVSERRTKPRKDRT